MSEDSDDEKPKGFDISKLGLEMSDEERAAADEQLKSRFRELAEGGAMMKDALRGIGGVSALQDAMGSMNSLQDAFKASGITSMQDQINDAVSGLASSGLQDHLSALTGAGVMNQLNAERDAIRKLQRRIKIVRVLLKEKRGIAIRVVPHLNRMGGIVASDAIDAALRKGHL
jgi:hypothetical protein